MKNEIAIVGNIADKNTTIIGASQSGKTSLGKQLQNLGYYYLSFDNLKETTIDKDKIKSILNIDNYLEATNKQNLVLANILDLVNVGTKKIVIDDLLTLVDIGARKKFFDYLNKQEIRFVNITMDIEDTLFADYVIVMLSNQVAIEGATLEVLKEEKILKRIGLSLPFIIDLSIQLQYYGLVEKIYLNKEELVDRLWK